MARFVTLSIISSFSSTQPPQVMYDALQKQRTKAAPCQGTACLGSLMMQKPHQAVYSEEEVVAKAREFFQEYQADQSARGEEVEEGRMAEVEEEMGRSGTYTLRSEELEFGARTAWRNAARCPARVIWRNLALVDKREVETAEEMFKAICEHMKVTADC